MSSADDDALNDPEIKAKIMEQLKAIAEKNCGDTKWKEIEEPGTQCKQVNLPSSPAKSVLL